MGKLLSKGEMAYALGKLHDMVSKIESILNDLSIDSQNVDQALQVLNELIENEINNLKDKP